MPVLTEVVPLEQFYPGEDYHQTTSSRTRASATARSNGGGVALSVAMVQRCRLIEASAIE